MPKRKPLKKKPPKKKVKKPKPKRRPQPVAQPADVQPEPGVLIEGPVVPPPAGGMPSGSPGNVGHWNHPEEEEIE
jgi:hypothetical protein